MDRLSEKSSLGITELSCSQFNVNRRQNNTNSVSFYFSKFSPGLFHMCYLIRYIADVCQSDFSLSYVSNLTFNVTEVEVQYMIDPDVIII